MSFSYVKSLFYSTIDNCKVTVESTLPMFLTDIMTKICDLGALFWSVSQKQRKAALAENLQKNKSNRMSRIGETSQSSSLLKKISTY